MRPEEGVTEAINVNSNKTIHANENEPDAVFLSPSSLSLCGLLKERIL